MRFYEIAPIKPVQATAPLTPDKARIDNLKRQKDKAGDALSAERDRQKIHKAQQNLVKTIKPHL